MMEFYTWELRFLWVIAQRVVVYLTDISGQPTGPIFKGQEPKKKAGHWLSF